MDRVLRRPAPIVLWFIAVALGLGTAAAKGLNAPSGLWIGVGCAAIIFVIAAVVVHVRPRPPTSVETDPRDLALSLASELEEASDHVGTALRQGEWWLPAESPMAAVWDAREAELRAFGVRFHKPVRDAYRKVAQLNRKAAQVEQAAYEAVGRVVDDVGHDLSAANRDQLEATHGVITHALERLAELESTPGEDQRVATEEHRDTLRGALNGAQHAVGSGTARPEGDRLMREMFAAHFPELDERLAEWDRAVTRNVSAPGRLKAAIEAKVQAESLDHAPYQLTTIVEGLALVTAERSLAGRLAEPLPPAVGDPTALWRGWASDHVMAGMVDFNSAVTTAHGNVIVIESEEYPVSEFEECARKLLAPLHELLTEMQLWPEATEILASREALRAYPKDVLIEDLKKAQLKPSIPVVAGCHGCD